MTPLFDGFSVDSEYNGDKWNDNDRKTLKITQDSMKKIGRKVNSLNCYMFTPDIIIHKRGTNENNLVVIEVKKDSNSEKRKQYDILKLENLTTCKLGNHYNFKLGVSLLFETGKNAGKYQIKYFQKGEMRERNNLE